MGGGVELAGDEAHYLRRVVRVRPGEIVGATDGAGGLASLEVIEATETAQLRVVARETVTRRAELEVWCGAPEGDRADWLVEKLAELGAARLRPVDGRRGRWERFEARRARWERLAVAALRQSRSAFLLEVLPPAPLERAIEQAPTAQARWVCRPDGVPAPGRLTVPAGRAIAVVGPSSGFSDEELKLLSDNGFDGISLAGARLRTETAAVAVAALWAAADNPDA